MNDVVFNLMYQNLIKFQYHQEKIGNSWRTIFFNE